MKCLLAACLLVFLASQSLARMSVDEAAPVGDDVILFDASGVAAICVDPHDAAVVQLATGLLADDLERVSGHRAKVLNDLQAIRGTAIVVGTIGQSSMIDRFIQQGRIDVSKLKNQWESFAWQTITDPVPGVHRALVIAGSDRRGTAYGVMELSKSIGVSPWYWWADVPVTKHAQLRVSAGSEMEGPPAIKYRGIFLNDEDWGLRPWATQTFDPTSPGIGPKTYGKVFELMLRLRLNYIWPAMHPGRGSSEFSTFAGNSQLADQWAIVTGSSHCEPMLRNNIFWPEDAGPWRYDINRDAILNYWKASAIKHGNFESVWTLGIRGIHDQAMQGPSEQGKRIAMVEQTITDQRSLIDQFVNKSYGTPAQCFVPYKEVLPLYDAGMKVPEDVTLVWPDDNFGYVRRLGTPAERKRSGGSGVYYHLSYWGLPHSYLWVESTPPALMWEELRKAYDNDAKNIWIVNVGDIKPAELCIDFFANLAWNPAAFGPDSQTQFMARFDRSMFASAGQKVESLQESYYALASVRKPETMSFGWADSLSRAEAEHLFERYRLLLEEEKKVAETIPVDRADAYFEMVGYSVRMLAASGLFYLGEPGDAKRWKRYIDQQTEAYNNKVAGGKWRGMMSNAMEGLTWPAEVGGTAKAVSRATARPADQKLNTIGAWAFSSSKAGPTSHWQAVDGLGWSGHAMTVLPATSASITKLDELHAAPSLEYGFAIRQSNPGEIYIHALPTLRLTPADHLRIAVRIDRETPVVFDIPGGESDNELGKARREGVLNNRVTMTVPVSHLPPGNHTLKIYGVDPGVVLDQIDLPF